jgi:pimeloyl-ACP methyl ester carboxylesterase
MSTLRTVDLVRGGDTLLVLLPGAYMQPENFVAAGFLAALESRQLALDLRIVALDVATITGSNALLMLQQQILDPARADYRHVWLGGISLGGLLALCQAADQPQTVDGLCLLAPYPGSRLTANAIARAGGLAAWEASPEQLADPEFRAWRWLKSPPVTLPVFVGYGTEDRFADGMRQIAECFPVAARCTVPGDHDWPAWQQLWEHFLDRFPDLCAAPDKR